MESVSPSVNFPEIESRVLAFWQKHDTFRKSLEIRKNAKPYMFYDGPPFATGTPHYGHLLAGTIKDIIPRYQTMKGFFVERRFGWDTHGLPIEMLTERELGIKGRKEILALGVDKFNEACRAGVLKYVQEWERVTNRLGRWIDFRDDYKTMDLKFMDSVWWVFKQLWDKGRIYEGWRVVPYSWRLSTPLSNFEATSNYKDVQDPALTLRFKIKEKPGTSALAWTTTPWTLITNLAVCAGPDIDYVEIRTKDGEQLILAKARLEAYFKKKTEYEILSEFKGTELTKYSYEPLFPYYADLADKGAFQFLTDDYVSTEDGTGLVHLAPGHGEDDFRILQARGLPLLDATDDEGSFTDVVPSLKGMNIKDADKEIIRDLKERDFVYKHETIVHSYPYCERSNTPLMGKAISAWYVKVEDIREKMVQHNSTIHWIPEHIKEGRFGKWLEGARDWNISRNRFWGNPLPIWRCESCKEAECLGSYKDLEARVGKPVTDLHKHFVDDLHWKCTKCGGQMTRIPEVLDCWFESGSMPYAHLHYPFENRERFDAAFPADFIAEGLDQTRGWFYTLVVLSSSLFNKAPFKNVVVNGMILAEDGKKMSKRLQNYPDPTHIIETYGADALRLYMIKSPVVRGESLRFSESGVKDVVRTVLLPFWNVYSFFTTYANIDKYKPDQDLTSSKNDLDRWIISRVQTLLAAIEKEMSEYRLYAVVPCLVDFLEELTNWYLRRSRRRFWLDDVKDKQDGYNTLYYILTNFSKALAPFLPFASEEIFRNVATLAKGLPESVHLTDYPGADDSHRNAELERAMALIQQTVGLGRALRVRENLRVRQPLNSITVVTRNENDAGVLKRYGEHIQEELNVKAVLFSTAEENLVEISVKPNFPLLGPIFGKEMKSCAQELSKLSRDQIAQLEQGGTISILGRDLDLSSIEIVRKAKSDIPIETAKGVTVYFDTKLTPELISEGFAREFVNRVQRMRKEADFQITDRITVRYHAASELTDSLSGFVEYIKEETLAPQLVKEVTAPDQGELVQKHEIEQFDVVISVARVVDGR